MTLTRGMIENEAMALLRECRAWILDGQCSYPFRDNHRAGVAYCLENKQCGCVIKERVAKINALLAAPAGVVAEGWIPVSERLPEENGEVLVVAAVDSFHGSTATYFDRNAHHQFGMFKNAEVSHWMPLPAAPKEKPND